jgi:hypothetical protein
MSIAVVMLLLYLGVLLCAIRRKIMETLWTKSVPLSHAEKEYMLAPYDPIYGLLMDYAGMHAGTAHTAHIVV